MRNHIFHLAVAALIGTWLTLPMTLSAAEDQSQSEPDVLTLRMEAHWQKLIREKDPERRRALIQEHRALMNEAQSAMHRGPRGRMGMGQPHGGMMSDRAMQNMQHRMEMHSMMLEMMQ